MTEVHHGLEGVVAFESEIAEPDKEGSALRYRGVDIEDLVGRVPFENVWGLLIDGAYTPGLAPAEPYNLPVHTGDVRVDVQAAVAMLAPASGSGSGSARPTTSPTSRPARTSDAWPSWSCPTPHSPRAA
uniref:citrate/2-methylcitrate synthase n=1 Tax=Nocardioides rubriscoriae TaxID=642762 RepID=UPI003CCC60B9